VEENSALMGIGEADINIVHSSVVDRFLIINLSLLVSSKGDAENVQRWSE